MHKSFGTQTNEAIAKLPANNERSANDSDSFFFAVSLTILLFFFKFIIAVIY
jgi:hypothetical protein